jgi:hypothetical protein
VAPRKIRGVSSSRKGGVLKNATEIQKTLDKIRGLVNEGDQTAEIIWDSLTWAMGAEGAQNPVEAWIDSEA